MIGQTISHYKVTAKLGEGGMGVVYKAEDLKLGRAVALKFLPSHLLESEEHKTRFLHEARAAAALDHPNICTIYEIDEAGGQTFLAMAFVAGQTLKQKIAERPLPLAEAFDIAVQIGEGLKAAHETGIVHRDIKPANIMITPQGQAKIMDFGLARLSTSTRLTRTGSSLGTPAYMSPEAYQGDDPDARSDLWSLGVVIYEMVAGRPPFAADSEAALLYAVLNTEPEPLTARRADVPLHLDRIVTKALSKDRRLRYQHVDDLVVDLRAQRGAGLPPPAKAQPARTRIWMAAAVAAVVLAIAAGLWARREHGRAAREQAMKQVESLADAGALIEAYRLARVLEEQKPGDPKMERVWDTVAMSLDILTDPPGADVFIRDYLKPDSEWIHLGRSPLKAVRLPIMLLSTKVQKQGYSNIEWALPFGAQPVKLTPLESTPAGMVRVLGDGGAGQAIPLDDFWLDRYETTNAEYKKFVDSGGYRDPKFWKQPFIEGARTLTRGEGMARLRDSTGRAGPANWELGDYPEGKGDLPVTGVSWFEAAAYCGFVGKELPTVHHWRQAALYIPIFSEMIPLSNFGGKGPAAPGTFKGAGFFGTYDMAGNVKEWCWNANGEKRHILGGAWPEPSYMFAQPDAHSPFDRGETFGFRCALYTQPIPENIKAPVTRKLRDYSAERPVSEEQFQAFKTLYSYDRAPLEERIEAVDDSDPVWRKEKISLNAAYGGERLIVYLYLPKRTAPPYQTVVHFPGVPALLQESIDSFTLHWASYVVQSGRALLYPIYKGTFERRPKIPVQGALARRDQTFQWCKDLGRALDYAETRPDLDPAKLAFHGISMGSSAALPCLAVEDRFKAAVLLEGGLGGGDSPPETDPFHFAPRIRVPTLMINGKDDFVFPVEQLQLPLFRLLAAAPADKRHVLVEGGHAVPRIRVVKETLDWLDRYFGPVNGVP